MFPSPRLLAKSEEWNRKRNLGGRGDIAKYLLNKDGAGSVL